LICIWKPFGFPPRTPLPKREERDFSEKKRKAELLATIDDMIVQVMPSIGDKSRTYHRQELPDERGFCFCLVAFRVCSLFVHFY